MVSATPPMMIATAPSPGRRSRRLVATLLLALAWVAVTAPTPSAADAAATEAAGGSADPRAFLSGLFGEPTLDEVMAIAEIGDAPELAPWRQFRQARDARARGDTAAATAALRSILQGGDSTTAVALWAWANLRRLGEVPPASIADQVRGVVYEVPVDTGVEYLAAYADGRWRILDATGRGVFWETANDPASLAITDAILAGGQRLTYWTPEPAARATGRPEGIRVTLLTFAGPRQMVFDPSMFAEDAPTHAAAGAISEGFGRLVDLAVRVDQAPD